MILLAVEGWIMIVLGIIAFINLIYEANKKERRKAKEVADIVRRVNGESDSKKPGNGTSKDDVPLEEVSSKEYDGLTFTEYQPVFECCEMLISLKGLSYRSDEEIERSRTIKQGDKLILQPEPDNPKDKFALKILTEDGYHIGYVPQDCSEAFARNFQYFELAEAYHDFSEEGQFVLVRFYGKSMFYWKKYLMDKSTYYAYKDKYEELNENLYRMSLDNPQGVLDIWKGLLDDHPDDEYFRYNYIESLHANGQYEKAIEEGEKFRERLNLYCFPHLEFLIRSSYGHLEKERYAAEYKKYGDIYNEGYSLLKDKQYEAALKCFLRCVDSVYQIQALPKNICKCYERLKLYPYLLEYARNVLTEDWLTESSRKTIQGYIDKYSKS